MFNELLFMSGDGYLKIMSYFSLLNKHPNIFMAFY